MNRVTGRKLKQTLILGFCLYITITNCDGKSFQKRSTLGSNRIELAQNSDQSVKPATNTANKTAPSSVNPEPNQSNPPKNKNTTANNSEVINDTLTSKDSSDDKTVPKVKPGTIDKTTKSSTTTPPVYPNDILPPVNTGALMRGVSVFLGLSLIVVAYIIFRCARLNKNRTQMVRKYGILAHRQDVEMRPLPLDDEDEDDNTVFDASEVAVHDKQRRST